jgi:uncharacterized protein (TIGR02611 family)
MAVEGYGSGARSVWAFVGRYIRRTALFVIGLVIILFGILLLLLPGPGWLTIFLGVSVWSIEFQWARRLRLRVQRHVRAATDSVRRRATSRVASTFVTADLTVVPEQLIDLARYPVTDLDSPATRSLIAAEQRRLADHGVSIMRGFLTDDAVARLCREADELAPQAFFSEAAGTPYLERPDRSFPEGHPRRAIERSSLRALAYDLFPATSALRALYEWDPMMEFIGAVLDRTPLYRYADHMGALNLAVMIDGDELGWHFDQTDFVVSIALQDAESGGDFESARHIRSDGDERYDDVAKVLGGESHASIELVPMTPGTLMLFAGRNSMHRVTAISGTVPRYVALLAYDTRPDTVSSDQLKLARYGRLA